MDRETELHEKNAFPLSWLDPDRWPEGVSDGLTLTCADCGEVPCFDYSVEDAFWTQHVSGPERIGVVCLLCLDKRCGGVGLADAILQVQFCGTGFTVVLQPLLRVSHTRGKRSIND